jgi:hypothetical protein
MCASRASRHWRICGMLSCLHWCCLVRSWSFDLAAADVRTQASRCQRRRRRRRQKPAAPAADDRQAAAAPAVAQQSAGLGDATAPEAAVVAAAAFPPETPRRGCGRGCVDARDVDVQKMRCDRTCACSRVGHNSLHDLFAQGLHSSLAGSDEVREQRLGRVGDLLHLLPTGLGQVAQLSRDLPCHS